MSEMHYRRVGRQLGIALTPAQDWACCWLEWEGLRFLVDFGVVNAPRLAREYSWSCQRNSRLVH
jgi:hypothetical protein